MLSDEMIAEYDEAQDPDYEPTEEETPDEPLEYDSQAEISQEHIADEEVAEGTTAKGHRGQRPQRNLRRSSPKNLARKN